MRRTCRVASRGTRVMGMPDAITSWAASGSTKMLNSAHGVTLPGPRTTPPMITSRRTRRMASGSRRIAVAMLVSGPSATTLSVRPRRRASSTRRPAASRSALGAAIGKRGAPDGVRNLLRPPSPSEPCTLRAVCRRRFSGAAAPIATGGIASGAIKVSRRRALSVPWRTGTLPATVVMSSTESSGERSASISARASSIPGSVSMATRRARMPVTRRPDREPLGGESRSCRLRWLRRGLPPFPPREEPGCVRVREAVADHAVHDCAQGLPVAGDAERDDRLVVPRELAPGDDLHGLVQGAEAAGQHHEGVRALEHHALARVHVVDHHELRQVRMAQLELHEETGDHPGDLASVAERRAGEDAHDADSSAPVDEPDAAFGKTLPERLGGSGEGGIGPVSGTAEDGDGTHDATLASPAPQVNRDRGRIRASAEGRRAGGRRHR